MAPIVAAVSVVRVIRFALQPRWLAWHLLLVVVLVSFTLARRLAARRLRGQGRRRVPRRPGPPRRSTGSAGRAGGWTTATSAVGCGDRQLRPGRHHGWSPARDRAGPRRHGLPGRDPAAHRPAACCRSCAAGCREQARPAAATPTGEVTVTGLLQRSETGPPPGGPAIVPAGQLPYVATVTLLDALPYRRRELYDGYLALRSEQPPPTARPVPVEARGRRGRRGRPVAQPGLRPAVVAVRGRGGVLLVDWCSGGRRWSSGSGIGQPDAGPPSLVAPRRTT